MRFALAHNSEPFKFLSHIQQINNVSFFNPILQDGRSETAVAIDAALMQLAQREYPLSVLLARPLPEGCDPTRLEIYLTDDDFLPAIGIERSAFERQPLWKQTNIKKNRGLF